MWDEELSPKAGGPVDARMIAERVRDRKSAARREYQEANALAKLLAAVDALRAAGLIDVANKVVALVRDNLD